MHNISDKLLILFIFMLLIWFLVVSSSFTNPMPGLFAIVNRGNGRDTTKFNDINTYSKTRSKSQNYIKRSSKGKKAFIIYSLMTLIVFFLTVVATKLEI